MNYVLHVRLVSHNIMCFGAPPCFHALQAALLTAMLHRAQFVPLCNPCALCQEARAVIAASDAPVAALMPVAAVMPYS